MDGASRLVVDVTMKELNGFENWAGSSVTAKVSSVSLRRARKYARSLAFSERARCAIRLFCCCKVCSFAFLLTCQISIDFEEQRLNVPRRKFSSIAEHL